MASTFTSTEPSFLLLAFVAFSDLVAGRGTAAMVRGPLLILAVFTTVVLHDFGHVLAARCFGELLALDAAGRQTGSSAVRAGTLAYLSAKSVDSGRKRRLDSIEFD